MKRFLYLKICGGVPYEIKHFTDRSAGLKHMHEQSGTGTPIEALWSDEWHRAHTFQGLGGIEHWLYEVEIF